jgi:hypothetical protein
MVEIKGILFLMCTLIFAEGISRKIALKWWKV